MQAMPLKDRYDVIKVLNKGSSSRTILARATSASISALHPSDRVVIKQVFTPKARLEDLAQRLQGIGDHPQLPQLVDSWQTAAGQFFAFEYIDAPPIDRAVAPPWSNAQVETLLLNMLPVLEHIHSFRMVHGDICPKNLRQGQPPILVDLRLAQVSDVPGGDAAYGAPEQALGQLVYGSDLYSLGLVAVHLMTGLSPFELFSMAEDRWVWADLVTVPKPLATVLERLLERSLEDRYDRAGQALMDLKQGPASPLQMALSLLPTKAVRSLAPSSRHLRPGQKLDRPQVKWQQRYRLMPGAVATALAMQGDRLALGTGQGEVTVCDLTSGEALYQFASRQARHSDRIRALVFHPQGQLLYSASADGTVKVWDLIDGKLVHTMAQFSGLPTTLALAPTCLAVGDSSGQITLWQPESFEREHCFSQHQEGITALALAASGQLLASLGRDRSLRLWSLTDRQLLETVPLSAAATTLALHPSGNHAVLGSQRGTVDVWHRQAEGPSQERLCSTDAAVTALALSPDARLLAVGTQANTVRLYRGASGHCVSELLQEWGTVALAFDGSTLVSSGRDEILTVWQRQAKSVPVP